MADNILPLLIFTLLVQFSAGIVIIYGLFLLFPHFRSKNEIPRRFKWILIVASAAALVGVVASFLHLGSPLKAFRAVANLGNSSLSLEILTVLVFLGSLLTLTVIQFVIPYPRRRHHWLTIITLLAGLLVIYVMATVYQLPTRPAWNSIFTPVGFYLAALVTGSALLLLFQINSGSWASQKALAILIIAIPAIHLALLPFHMGWLGKASEATRASLEVMLGSNLVLFLLGLITMAITIGTGFWALFSIKSGIIKNRFLFIPSIAAFLFAWAAMIIDRVLFYLHGVAAGGL
ncbi:MAG: DmsC/YnfH family molybdoenzyme membrane anchor subunit [Bacteroidales bacterium]